MVSLLLYYCSSLLASLCQSFTYLCGVSNVPSMGLAFFLVSRERTGWLSHKRTSFNTGHGKNEWDTKENEQIVFRHYSARQKGEVRPWLDKSTPVAAELSARGEHGCGGNCVCWAGLGLKVGLLSDSGSQNYAAVYNVLTLARMWPLEWVQLGPRVCFSHNKKTIQYGKMDGAHCKISISWEIRNGNVLQCMELFHCPFFTLNSRCLVSICQSRIEAPLLAEWEYRARRVMGLECWEGRRLKTWGWLGVLTPLTNYLEDEKALLERPF